MSEQPQDHQPQDHQPQQEQEDVKVIIRGKTYSLNDRRFKYPHHVVPPNLRNNWPNHNHNHNQNQNPQSGNGNAGGLLKTGDHRPKTNPSCCGSSANGGGSSVVAGGETEKKTETNQVDLERRKRFEGF
ncbi:unnamed protein product [Ambrosiozyma monospora]|uniref:Unnamed protein product n=1 Tax=Ambrosiozyma monospora TaxID=43982 RepID=A0ACB5SY21_AMBMO|nr:unnamed protein product [Ambrosiozyma monospora]